MTCGAGHAPRPHLDDGLGQLRCEPVGVGQVVRLRPLTVEVAVVVRRVVDGEGVLDVRRLGGRHGGDDLVVGDDRWLGAGKGHHAQRLGGHEEAPEVGAVRT